MMNQVACACTSRAHPALGISPGSRVTCTRWPDSFMLITTQRGFLYAVNRCRTVTRGRPQGGVYSSDSYPKQGSVASWQSWWPVVHHVRPAASSVTVRIPTSHRVATNCQPHDLELVSASVRMPGRLVPSNRRPGSTGTRRCESAACPAACWGCIGIPQDNQ